MSKSLLVKAMLVLTMTLLVSCTNRQMGTVGGAAVGGVVGNAVGGTAGAEVGAVGGGVIGNQITK